MAKQPDFVDQVGMLEKLIVGKGLKIIFYPKFHPEINYIENFWGAAKRYARTHCDNTGRGLLETLPKALGSVSITELRPYARKAQR